jgi:hypothetical protein
MASLTVRRRNVRWSCAAIRCVPRPLASATLPEGNRPRCTEAGDHYAVVQTFRRGRGCTVAEYTLWDSDLTGFGIQVMSSGRRIYLIQYRVGTRSRRLSLGSHGVPTTEQARSLAIGVLASVKAGADPAEERKQRRNALTVRDLAERFDREHISVRVKDSTAKE